MSGAILDRMSAAILSHVLSGHGQDLGDIAGVLLAAAKTAKLHQAGHNRIVTDPASRRADWRRINPRLPDGSPYLLPRMTATMRPDAEGDLIVSVREIDLGPELRFYREGVRTHVSLVVTRVMPEAVCIGMQGEPLKRVVSHPALDPLDLVVRRIGPMAPYRLESMALGRWANGSIIEMEPFGKIIARPSEGQG